jgi:hypothetical protein
MLIISEDRFVMWGTRASPENGGCRNRPGGCRVRTGQAYTLAWLGAEWVVRTLIAEWGPR